MPGAGDGLGTPPAILVIPARGGSQGVPRKNLEEVGGVSLIERAVSAAIRATLVSLVVVSTDDDEIAEAATRAGASVIRRPTELSGDGTTSEEVLMHALESMDTPADILVMVQCTSPFIDPADIDGTIELISSGRVDAAFTASDFHGFLWEGLETVSGVNHEETSRQMRQERPPQYLETGGVYAMRLDGFLQAKHRFFGRIAVYEVPRSRSLEIDTHDDLELARAVARSGLLESNDSIGPIEAVAMDFDGVLTDNTVTVQEDGTEGVVFDRSDGWGISLMKEMGIPMIVLSSEQNPVVAQRCAKLGIPFVQGLADKGAALAEWMRDVGIDPQRTAFIGNDTNDLSALRLVGFPVVPVDAHPDVRREARVVLSARGGRGAIREFASRVKTLNAGAEGF